MKYYLANCLGSGPVEVGQGGLKVRH